MNRIRWSQEESDLLKKVYKYKTANQLAEIFPQYTNTQILRRAKKLGLKKDPLVAKESREQNKIIQRQDLWTDEELKILSSVYPYEGAYGVQGKLEKERSIQSIISQANKYKICRIKKDLFWKQNSIEINDGDIFSVKFIYKGQ
ncbi:hypothetical protein [Lysinibacillus sp. NPDC086135]|uniref:hypothetical protein n=1 Tax=Lysinibacillus sp. NPDC086135 TaxID=3364130 RepID=UPI00381923ED